MYANGVDVDGFAQEVLAEFISADEDVLDTVDIRERLKLEASSDASRRNQNRKIKLRFEKLDEAGLGEMRPGGTLENGRTAPKQLQITDVGRQFVADHEIADEVEGERDESLRQRVDRLEREQAQMRESVEEDINNLYVVLGVLFRDMGIDVETVEAYGIDPDRMGKPSERGEG